MNYKCICCNSVCQDGWTHWEFLEEYLKSSEKTRSKVEVDNDYKLDICLDCIKYLRFHNVVKDIDITAKYVCLSCKECNPISWVSSYIYFLQELLDETFDSTIKEDDIHKLVLCYQCIDNMFED